jgi:hypothetical protein
MKIDNDNNKSLLHSLGNEGQLTGEMHIMSNHKSEVMRSYGDEPVDSR